jgi:hypothetical protein
MQIKAAEELIDKAILHADKMLINSQSQEPGILSEMIAANAELEEASSLLRKLEEKDESARNTKKKIDRNAPSDSFEAENSLVKTDRERKAEAAEREATQLKIAVALERKTNCTARLRVLHESKADLQSTLTRLYMQRIHTNTAESKKFCLMPSINQSLRVRSLVQLQCVISGCVESRDLQGVFAVLIRDLSPAVPAMSSPTPNSHSVQSIAEAHPISEGLRAETLLDVSRVACQMGLSDLSVQSFEAALRITCPASSVLRVKMDLSRALHMVAEGDSGACQENPAVPVSVSVHCLGSHLHLQLSIYLASYFGFRPRFRMSFGLSAYSFISVCVDLSISVFFDLSISVFVDLLDSLFFLNEFLHFNLLDDPSTRNRKCEQFVPIPAVGP